MQSEPLAARDALVRAAASAKPLTRGNALELWRRLAPFLLLALAPVIAHALEFLGVANTSPALRGTMLATGVGDALLPGVPFIDNSAGIFTLSLGHLAAESFLHYHLPWWNPYTGVGLPLASNIQSSSFFLPFVLLLHYGQGVLYLKTILQILAGCFCYALLRRLSISCWAATLAAILFECNGSFAFYADPSILPIAFLPMLLFGIEEARAKAVQGSGGGQTCVALAIAYSLLAGFPETAFLDGLLALAWMAVTACSLDKASAVRFCRSVAVGGLIGLALASPALVPFLHDFSISTLGPLRLSSHPTAILRRSLPLLFFPYVYGAPMSRWDYDIWSSIGGYFGTVLALLALLGASGRRAPRNIKMLLSVWLALGLGAAAGVPVLEWFARTLPGARAIVICRYGFPAFSLCLCILAAFALDEYASRREPLAVRRAVMALSLSAAAALAIALHHGAADVIGYGPSASLFFLSTFWAIAAPLALAWLLRRRPTRFRYNTIAAIVVADALVLFMPPLLTSTGDAQLSIDAIGYLESHAGFYRTVSFGNVLWPNSGAYLATGILDWAYFPVPNLWANHFLHAIDRDSSQSTYPGLFETALHTKGTLTDRVDQLEQMAVRYVVSPTWVNVFGFGSGGGAARRVFSKDGVDIFELIYAKPYEETQGGSCILTLQDREHLQAECDAPARLLRRELAFPGWHARVNGERAPVKTVDGVFQEIALPAGKSTVVWRYIPEFARTMTLIFAAGLASLLALNLPARSYGLRITRALQAARRLSSLTS